jgi:hypothetical protein
MDMGVAIVFLVHSFLKDKVSLGLTETSVLCSVRLVFT